MALHLHKKLGHRVNHDIWKMLAPANPLKRDDCQCGSRLN